MKSTLYLLVVLVLCVLTAFGINWLLQPPKREAPTAAAVASAVESDIAYYTCSMHPSVHSQVPGDCPICGMKLIPVKSEDQRTGVIRVDADRRQAIGVTTAPAQERELTLSIRAAAVVVADDTRLTDISMRVPGWVVSLAANAVGATVAKDAPLFTFYSPDLVAAQGEYLGARAAGEGPVLAAARAKLVSLGLTEAQVAQLVAGGKPIDPLPVLAPSAGAIIEKTAVAGSRVEAGMRILRLADLSTVWVEAALRGPELDAARIGQAVELEFPDLPGPRSAGTIALIVPAIDETTRTGRARIVMPNADGRLKPGQLAIATLRVPLGRKLAVPTEAIIVAGDRRLVFIDLGDDRLKPVLVTVGVVGTDDDGKPYTEISEGLADGAKVVTSGVFLLASESRIKAGMDLW